MKTKLFISALAVVLSIGMVTAQNQNQVKKDTTTSVQKGHAFVDKNNNGVCDNLENGTPGNTKACGKQRMHDGSGCGHCKGMGLKNGKDCGQCKNFVDADKNGVCDNYEKGMPQKGHSHGKGAGLCNGKGCSTNFVDANKNGVCDHREK